MILSNILDVLFQNKEYNSSIANFYEKYVLTASYSYEEIIKHSQNFAKNISKHIESHREPILISLDTSAEFLFSFFGVVLSGNIPVPIAPSTLLLPKDYQVLLEQISEACEANHIISKLVTKSTELNTILVDELYLHNSKEDFSPEIKSDDICFIQFSSGSTQAPKGVAVTHKNIMSNLEQITEGMAVTNKDKICSWLPFHHDMGLIGSLLASLYSQVESHFFPPVDFILAPYSWLKLLSEKEITVIVAPNSAYNVCSKRVKEDQVKELNLSSLRLALSGAEPVNADICKKFLQVFKAAGLNSNVFFPVYGLAEATLAVTFPKVGSPLKTLQVDYDAITVNEQLKLSDNKDSSIELVSCGSPLNGIELDIIKKDGTKCGEGQIGQIMVRGPAIVKKYYQKQSHLNDGWLATGDLGFLYQGQLYIIGRIKDLIIVNGKNIAANDLEAKSCIAPQIRLGRIVAFSFLDKKQKEQVKIVAEVCDTSKKNREKLKLDLCHHLKSITPIKPEDIFFVPPLLIKKTTSGKVKRYYIKHKYLTGRVKYWEKFYRIFFLRSQFIILWLKLTYIFKERLAADTQKGLNYRKDGK